jgi:hypothetical protein
LGRTPAGPGIGDRRGNGSGHGRGRVDAAIIVSTFNLYRYDPSYALKVYAKYPERFRVV